MASVQPVAMPLAKAVGAETDYKALADELKSDGIFRVRYAHPDAADLEKMERVWGEEEITTISTWGQFQNVVAKEYRNLDDTEYPIKLTRETLAEEFTKNGENIHWTKLRDLIAEKVFDGNKSQAGQARGCLNRFVEEMTEGSRLLATGPSGTRFGIVSEDAVYFDPTNPAQELEPHHKFYRPVTWLRNDQGDPVTIADESEYLPSALQPTRLTNTKVDEEDIDGLVTTFAAFDFLQP